jgi:uncharacterized membrane protein
LGLEFIFNTINFYPNQLINIVVLTVTLTVTLTLIQAYVRAVRGFQTMLFQLVFSVLPTMLELFLVSNILYKRCGSVFAGVTVATFTAYLGKDRVSG